MSDPEPPELRGPGGLWQKGGPSPNPRGRPRKEIEREYLHAMMGEISIDAWKEIVRKARDQALRGDSKARDWIGKFLLGDPVHVHEYLFAKKEDVTIRVIFGSGNQPLLEGQQPIEGDWDIVDADAAELEAGDD